MPPFLPARRGPPTPTSLLLCLSALTLILLLYTTPSIDASAPLRSFPAAPYQQGQHAPRRYIHHNNRSKNKHGEGSAQEGKRKESRGNMGKLLAGELQRLLLNISRPEKGGTGEQGNENYW